MCLFRNSPPWYQSALIFLGLCLKATVILRNLALSNCVWSVQHLILPHSLMMAFMMWMKLL